MRFVETAIFTREISAFLTDEEYRSLQLALLLRPEQGPLSQEVVAFGSLGGAIATKVKEVVPELSTIGTNKIPYICSLYIPRASRET
jgi:hypothetical protein